MNLPNSPSTSTKARNPDLWPHKSFRERAGDSGEVKVPPKSDGAIIRHSSASKGIPRPLLNPTETRYRDKLWADGISGSYHVMEQAITLRLDPPFKSYRPDLAYLDTDGRLVLVEVKGPHRFKEKGIAKAALAAKTYPQFKFELALWENKTWKVSALSP